MGPLADFLERVTPPRTPALVVRRSAFLANLAGMQQACDDAGASLRSHGKMAKSSRVALEQQRLGAKGICCQTVGEAEAYAAAGVRDILMTAPVPPWGWPVLAALCAGGADVAAVVDSPAQVAAAASGGAAAVTLLADLDGGQHRTGAGFADAPALVRAIGAAGFRWGGLQCYLGHLQASRHRAQAHADAMVRLSAVVEALSAAGLRPEKVTGGGTGTAALDLASGLFTELQAGSYAFMDVQYAEAGATFLPALFCAATLVSSRRKSHVTVDAGLKALAADGPLPRPVAGVPDGCVFRFMGDEHGALLHPDALAAFAEKGLAAVDVIEADAAFQRPAWAEDGALVWLQPGHIDPTVNLHDAFWMADEDGHLERWAIDARRTTR